MVSRACSRVALTTERVVFSSCWLLLLFPSSNTLTHGPRFRQDQLYVCYLWLPFHLSTPPGISRYPHPEEEPCTIYEVHTGKIASRGKLRSTSEAYFNPFRTAVPFGGQITQNLRRVSPKRDCGSKRVNYFPNIDTNSINCSFRILMYRMYTSILLEAI